MADSLDNETGQFDSRQAAQQTAVSPVAVWLEAIELAGKSEKDWRDDVKKATDIFRAKEGEAGTAFNLYHSNIQTIVPAIYNSTPIPDIRPRFPDPDPVARQGADVIERVLNHVIDEYDFDAVLECGTFDMSLAGRGVAKINYQPITGVVGQEPVMDDNGQPVMGEDGQPKMQPVEDIVYQTVTCVHVPWGAYRQGPGRSFNDIPWQAFAGYYTREALEKLSPEHGAKVMLDMQLHDEKDGADGDKPAKDIFKRALVWEIWDKESRKVLFIAPSYREAVLAEVDDPLELEGFFSTPAPLMGTRVPGDLTPICEYTIYSRLLKELDDITVRITRLIGQLRVKSAYAGKSSDIATWAEADDGEVVEVADAVAFLQSGGMDKALAWWPLDPTVKALQQLYTQREQVKQAIYEVTGMSDIVRGQSDPDETLGAQEIKTKWGAIRIRQRQKEVQRFARDLLRLKAEIICNKFTPQQLTQICGYNIDPQVFELFKNDKLRSYRVDIETDSTIQGDLQFNQQQMSSFVEATGSYFQGMTGPMQLGIMPPKTVMTIYGAFARNFNLGKQVEDELEQAVQFAAQQPSPQEQQQQQQQAEQQAQADQQAQQQQAEAQKAEQEQQVKAQEQQAKAQAEQEKAAQKQQEQQVKEQRAHELALEQERTKQAQYALEMQKHEDEMGLREKEVGIKGMDAGVRARKQENDGQMRRIMSDLAELKTVVKQIVAAIQPAGSA